MEGAWHVHRDGATIGPMTGAEVAALRATGQIGADALVWCDGMERWETCDAAGFAPRGEPRPEEASAQKDFPVRADDVSPRADAMDSAEAAPPPLPAVPATPPLVVADDGWQCTTPAPWRRYFARMFDTVVVGSLLWMVIGVVAAVASPRLYHALLAPGSLLVTPVVSSIAVMLSVIPVQAMFVGVTGMSLGKWIFGIRITHPDGQPIGWVAAFRRECRVTWSGLGLGIPIVALFTGLAAYAKLASEGATSWDREKPWLLTHRDAGVLQWVLGVGGVASWVALVVLLRTMAT